MLLSRIWLRRFRWRSDRAGLELNNALNWRYEAITATSLMVFEVALIVAAVTMYLVALPAGCGAIKRRAMFRSAFPRPRRALS